MRAYEILTEKNLAPGEFSKHAGDYIRILIRKIEDGEPVEVAPEAAAKYGDRVILATSNIPRIINAWFGSNEFPDTEKMNLTSSGSIIPADPRAGKLKLTTITGDELTVSQLQKTPEFKGGKEFNTGDIGEGMLGAAVTAKFIKRDQDITEKDVLDVIKKLGKGTPAGKNGNVTRGSMSATSANDTVYFNLSLNQSNYNALYGSAITTDKIHNDILGALRSSVLYANTNAGVKAAIDRVIADKNKNKITVNSDGVSNQKGTKADLFLEIDGTVINLLSLKSGSVQQFGQSSGYNFKQLDKFFNETFGVNIPDQLESGFVSGDPVKSFDAIHQAYNKVAHELQQELSGATTNIEARFIERLYNGIRHHATLGQDDTSMIILKVTHTKAGYTELKFGQALRDALDHIDIDIEYSAPGNLKPAKIEIFGKDDQNNRAMLLRMRSNFKSDSKNGYVRNIIEMGPLLKMLAMIEERQAENKETKKSGQSNVMPTKKTATTPSTKPMATTSSTASVKSKP